MAKPRLYSAMPLPILAGIAFACAITSPAPGATVTQGTPVTITGTLTASAVVVQVKLGAIVLGSASIVGLTWSYEWTPQSGDVGAQTINATATSASGTPATAAGVAVTVVSSAQTPLTLITSVAVRQWLEGHQGVTNVSGAASAWDDFSVNSYHVTQGTPSSRPAINTADATLNNLQTLTSDVTGAQILSNAAMPNGGTMWISAVIKLVTHISPRMIWGSKVGDAVEAGEFYCATSPNLAQYNGNSLNRNPNGGLPAGTWGRVEMLFSTTGSYLKCRGTLVNTDANVGSNSNTGCGIFGSQGGGALGANVAIYGRVVCAAEPTGPEKAALDAYWQAKCGAVNVLT